MSNNVKIFFQTFDTNFESLSEMNSFGIPQDTSSSILTSTEAQSSVVYVSCLGMSRDLWENLQVFVIRQLKAS